MVIERGMEVTFLVWQKKRGDYREVRFQADRRYCWDDLKPVDASLSDTFEMHLKKRQAMTFYEDDKKLYAIDQNMDTLLRV